VLVCDAERNVVLMNPAAEALLETRDWAQRRYHFDDLPLAPLADMPLRTADGQLQARYESHGRVLRARGAVLSAAEQAFSGEVIVLQNISEEVALDQAKTDLIAMISHELRTPLTSIQGAVDLLCKGIGGELVPLQLELAQTALRQSHTMSALIEKALTVANIEMGRLDPDLQPTRLSTVVETTLLPLRRAAEAAGIEIELRLPDTLPPVLIDPQMLKIALYQLVENAITYAGSGPVQIVARHYQNGVALAVRDYGPGIDAADLPHLFQGLRRGSDSLNKGPRGMGLGLMIAHELIERQGGRISVQSQVGKGSLFSIFMQGADDAHQSLVA
jgi:signal transduction histidine kinase